MQKTARFALAARKEAVAGRQEMQSARNTTIGLDSELIEVGDVE